MADWYGQARSNYFKVNDVKAFEKDMSVIQVKILYNKETDTCVMFSEDDFGAWSYTYYSDNEDECIDFDLVKVIASHLQPGEICVLVECGAEKLRYLTGTATAFDSSGKTVNVSLNDIYAKAKKKFGKTPTEAEY